MLTFSFLSSKQRFLRKKISLKVTARNQTTNVERQNTGLSMIAFYEYVQSKCTAGG